MNMELHAQAHKKFLANKEAIKKSLAESITKELEKLGDDIRGLPWFVCSSQRYWEQKNQKQ